MHVELATDVACSAACARRIIDDVGAYAAFVPHVATAKRTGLGHVWYGTLGLKLGPIRQELVSRNHWEDNVLHMSARSAALKSLTARFTIESTGSKTARVMFDADLIAGGAFALVLTKSRVMRVAASIMDAMKQRAETFESELDST